MIGEIRSGSSFQGLTHYLLHGSAATHRKTPAWVELRNLSTHSPEHASKEMAAVAAENSRVQRPVYHLILSPAPEDQLTREQWTRLADRVLEGLGLDEHQAVVALHNDTGTPHLHLAINRVHPQTSRAWATWRSKTRLEGILRTVERDWSLRRVEGRLASDRPAPARSSDLPPPTRRQDLHRPGTSKLSEWRRTLHPHFEKATSWTDLAARLDANGVRVTARGRGLVVGDDEQVVKVSSIDRAFSRARLEERFGQPFADWRAQVRRFDQAAELYGRRVDPIPSSKRSRALHLELRSLGRDLGWRPLIALRPDLPPAVRSLALAESRRRRFIDRPGESVQWQSLVKHRLAPTIARATSWPEAEARLRVYGAWIERDLSRGLVLTDGDNRTPLASTTGMASRDAGELIESWNTWRRGRQDLLRAAQRFHRANGPAAHLEHRWTRLARIIQQHELRIERYRALHSEFQTTERRLDRSLAQAGSSRLNPAHRRRVLDALQHTPPDRHADALARLVPSTRTLPGSRSTADRLAPTFELARDYHRLAREVRRAAPPAHAAHRRLPQLRAQAHTLHPTRARHAARLDLRRTLAQAARLGAVSLLTTAAPGLGTALRTFRAARAMLRSPARLVGRQTRLGLSSLLSTAAPGLGAALQIARFVSRAPRVSTELDRER